MKRTALALALALLAGCATPPAPATGSTYESRQDLRQTLRDLSRTVRDSTR